MRKHRRDQRTIVVQVECVTGISIAVEVGKFSSGSGTLHRSGEKIPGARFNYGRFFFILSQLQNSKITFARDSS